MGKIVKVLKQAQKRNPYKYATHGRALTFTTGIELASDRQVVIISGEGMLWPSNEGGVWYNETTSKNLISGDFFCMPAER